MPRLDHMLEGVFAFESGFTIPQDGEEVLQEQLSGSGKEIVLILCGDRFPNRMHRPAGNAEIDCWNAEIGGHNRAHSAAGGNIGAGSKCLQRDFVLFGKCDKGAAVAPLVAYF